jgi:hypothetical protein
VRRKKNRFVWWEEQHVNSTEGDRKEVEDSNVEEKKGVARNTKAIVLLWWGMGGISDGKRG